MLPSTSLNRSLRAPFVSGFIGALPSGGRNLSYLVRYVHYSTTGLILWVSWFTKIKYAREDIQNAKVSFNLFWVREHNERFAAHL